ncbi:unnamed protein product [Cyclocybe aegerita]|uniref:Uncharacterized protein n=1 Tax=Cyclocybe aegerita TaxID=1973307 RepID=A0A8S0VR79_CYCAE|nr:unnamed protein product [Cyclocybe aegerita]
MLISPRCHPHLCTPCTLASRSSRIFFALCPAIIIIHAPCTIDLTYHISSRSRIFIPLDYSSVWPRLPVFDFPFRSPEVYHYLCDDYDLNHDVPLHAMSFLFCCF